jgi:hypothetical protein
VNRGRGAGYWAAAASVLTLSSASRAAGPPPIVRVYVAGSAEAVSGSRDAIQDLCSRSNVAVVVRDAAGADEALLSSARAPGLADAYVDLRAGTPPRVVVVDGESRLDLERRTLPEDASLEISIETIAHVVCAAVESSLAARALAPAATAPVATEKPAAPHLESALGSETGWLARASLFASGADFGAGFRAGAGAGLGIDHGGAGLHFGALLSVIGYPAAGVERADGLASFGLFGARVLPMLEWQATSQLTAFAGVGAGADWIQISGERPPPGAISSGTGTAWEPMASGMLGMRLLLGRGISALFALDADVALARHRYVVQSAAGSEAFFQPSRVRPMALAGLSLSLGSGSEASRSHHEARR